MDDLAADFAGLTVLEGVEDLEGLVEVGKVARDVGVEDLEGLVAVSKVALPVGVGGLVLDVEEGLLLVPLDGKVIRFDPILVLEAGSS